MNAAWTRLTFTHRIARYRVYDLHFLGNLIIHEPLFQSSAHVHRTPNFTAFPSCHAGFAEDDDGGDFLAPGVRRKAYDCALLDLRSSVVSGVR